MASIDKHEEINDGMSSEALASAKAASNYDDAYQGKYAKPKAKKWIARINARIDYINRMEQPGRDTVLAFYNGNIDNADVYTLNDIESLLDETLYPLMKSFVDTLKPNLFFRNPKWNITSRRDDESFSKVDESVLNYSAEETGLETEINACVHEGILKGTGVLVYDFDLDRQVARGRQMLLEDVMVDNPLSWRLRDQSWIALRYRMPIEQAKIYFNDNRLKSSQTQKYDDSNSQYSIGSDRHLDELGEKEEIFEYFEVYAKYGDERKKYVVAEFSEEGPVFLKQLVFDEEGTEENGFKKWVKEADWPFVLDKEDFPVEFLRLSTSTDKFYGQIELAQLSSVVLAINTLLKAMNNRTRLAFSAKIALDKKLTPEQRKRLLSNKDFDVLELDVSQGKRLSDMIQIMDFSGVPQHVYEYYYTLKRVFDESSGFAELLRGGSGTGRKTATEASIVAEQAGLRIASKQAKIDKFLKDIGRKLRMINAQLTPVQVARDAANSEALKTEILFPAQVDAQEQPIPPKQQVIPWEQRQQDIGLIIGESNVEVAINSARRRSSDENIAMQSNLMAQFAGMIDPITQQPVLSGSHLVSFARGIMREAQIDNIDEKMPTLDAMQQRQQQAQQAQQEAMEQQQAIAEEQQKMAAESEENERQAEAAGELDDEMRDLQETGEMDEIVNSMTQEGAI